MVAASAPAVARPIVCPRAAPISAASQTSAPPIRSQRTMVQVGTPTESTATRLSDSTATGRIIPRHGCGRPWGTRADPGELGAAPGGGFGDEQCQAQQDQDTGQHRARGAVERGLELLEDRRGEGVEPQHREGPVFGEQVHRDQQSAAEDGQPQLRHHHPHEHRGRPGAQRTRGLLERGIESLERGGGRQVDEREVGQCGHQDGATETVQSRCHPTQA